MHAQRVYDLLIVLYPPLNLLYVTIDCRYLSCKDQWAETAG